LRLSILALSLALFSIPARADIRWISGADDLKQWGAVHCGGQGGTCPCMAPYWDPVWQTNYGPGSCSTSNTNTPLSLGPAGGRFQIVSPPPGQENVGKALRVELKNGDLWPCANGCAWATTRNELVYSKDTGTVAPTAYSAGDNRYFAWSTYFPAGFSSWSCNDSPECPGGVPSAYYNPWNVVTQWHHNADGGVPPLALALRRSRTSSNGYALVLIYGSAEGTQDAELWRQDLTVESWYDFVVHINFSGQATGAIEFWVGKNGGAKASQVLHCPGVDAVTCNVPTLYSDGSDFLKQGLYRNSSLLDSSVLFHKGMIDGDTYADVTGDFSLAPSPATVSAVAGKSAAYTIQTSASGAPQMISLAVTGLPPGVTSASFSPQTVLAGGSSILTLSTDATSPGVSGSFTVTGQYPGGAPGHAATAGITVTPPGPPAVATLVDSFGGSRIDPSLWTVTSAIGGTASESNGALRLAPSAWNSSSQIAVDSRAVYSLTGSSASVKVPGVVSAGCGVNSRFVLRLDNRNSLGFWFECGTLYAYSTVNGATTFAAQLTYSATSHLYWRIRESGGTVSWETSPDQARWTVRGSRGTSTLFALDAIKVRFFAETYAGLASPGVARYAYLNY
jgi:hypothetical protein